MLRFLTVTPPLHAFLLFMQIYSLFQNKQVSAKLVTEIEDLPRPFHILPKGSVGAWIVLLALTR
jgi:hypothetical protein